MENKMLKNKEMKKIFFDTPPHKFITPRVKELVWSTEAVITIVLTILNLILLDYFYQIDKQLYISNISILVVTFIGGIIAMIAFSLSALALILSSFDSEEIEDNIYILKNEKVDSRKVQIFAQMIYRFYFSGILNLVSIFLLCFGYLLLNIPVNLNLILLKIVCFITVYMVIFSLIFTVFLIPTCIKFKFLNYSTVDRN